MQVLRPSGAGCSVWRLATQLLAGPSGDIPKDLPLKKAKPNTAKWLREATILQPYGRSEYVALADPKDRPAKAREEFGFNAIIVQPPDSHNTVAAAGDRLTEEQFRNGVAAYRKAGYRVLLYTSVMALGLSPEFQSGKIAREHPDWQQKDPAGNPVLVWGVAWLCPNSGAREVALQRAIRITRKYHADGLMLDNNEFFFAAAGWTCHCENCQKGFRGYVRARFSVARSRELFGGCLMP